MNATRHTSSLGGFELLVLATGTFITLEADEDVPLDIRRL